MDVFYLLEQEAKRRKLSPRTIKTYLYCIRKFVKRNKKDPKAITKKDIKDFVDYLVQKDVTGNTINVYFNALKFLFEEVLGKRVMWKIKYSKTPKRLPVFLTKNEIKRLFEVIENPKHKLAIELMYSAGLRVSELINLKIGDLDFESKIGWVRQGKGKKDRVFILAEKLIPRISNYLFISGNKEYVLESKKGKSMHVRSIQEIVKRAVKKAKIKKDVHTHTLRHSFATHLIEEGYDVLSVQSLLGHSSAKTTMIYVHMVKPKLINVRSPFDNL